MNAAPSFAAAPKTGMASSDVSPHHATRSPRPTPAAASVRAMRLDAASSSPKVSSSGPIVAASRVGTTPAACRSTSPISSAIGAGA